MRTIETNCLPGSVKKQNLKVYSLAGTLLLVLFSATALAQTTISFPTSCTSKDLTLLRASLPAPTTNRCACSGDRSLVLGIHNGTGSTRTSFALWGTLIRKNASGTVVSTDQIFACAGPIPPSGDYFLNATTIRINGILVDPGTAGYPVIHVECGQSLDITDMHLAWTAATPGSTCDVLYNNPSTINPKCGTQDLIHVDLGVTSNFLPHDATCAGNDGSIDVTPSGGKPKYNIFIFRKETAGASDSTLVKQALSADSNVKKTFTGIGVGYYTIKVSDNSGGAPDTCWVNRFTQVTNPDNVTAPAYTSTDPGCRQTTGTVTVTSPQTGVTYTLEKPLGTIKYTANSSGVFSAVSPDTYILNGTKGTCSANTPNVIIHSAPATPATPSPTNNGPICAGTTLTLSANVTADSYAWTASGGFTSTAQNPSRSNATTAMAVAYSLVVTINGCASDPGSTTPTINAQPLAPTIIITQQPSLCGSATGSISVCSPNTNYTYGISRDGTNTNTTVWTNEVKPATTSTVIAFTDLVPGTNPIVRVRNGVTGCIAVASCSSAVAICPTTPNATNTVKQTDEVIQLADPTVKAYPNPFNDRVKFIINSPAAGNGSLEVYNVMGQRVKTVYQGRINAGNQSYELVIPKKQQETLIYVLRVDGKKVTGKLLQLNN
jgi:hypothetical protein